MTLYTGGLTTKDPDAADWPKGIDWTDVCAARGAGVTVTGSLWVITGPDSLLTQADDSIVTGSLKTQVKLSAGTLGGKYKVTNRVTFSDGGTDDRWFKVLVQ